MKALILAAATAAAISSPAHATEYGVKPALDAMGCAGSGIAQAFRGDFSNWVLPKFLGVKSLRAGQYIAVEYGADGVRRCVVRGG